MRIRVIQATICLVFAASYIYQAGKERPRVNAAFAALWGLCAGAYLTEILVEVTQ